MAIYEFAPGQSLVRDKRRHRSIGFTAPLQRPIEFPNGGYRTVTPDARWYTEPFHVALCPTCGGPRNEHLQPNEALTCSDCGTSLPVESFREFFTPAGFRTDFRPMSASDDDVVATIRRVVVAEIKEIATLPVEGTNLAIATGGDAAVFTAEQRSGRGRRALDRL